MTLPDDDFEAEHDIHILEEAEKIKDDASRQSRMRSFAERKRETFDKIVKSHTPAQRNFNNSTKGGMREPK